MPIQESPANMANAGRKHPVPQNVMDVEFKVVGDLTVRQVMYLFIGGLLTFVFYKSGLPFLWRWFMIISTALLSLAVAFVPIQERGLDKWLVSFISAIKNPTQRVWRKSYNPPEYFLADYAQTIKNEIITLTPAKSRSKLDEYLGTQASTTDYDEQTKEYINRIQKLYAQTTTVTQKVASQVTPTLSDIHKDEIATKHELTKQKEINRPIKNVPKELKAEIPINVKSKMPDTITLSDINKMKKQEKDISNEIEDLLKITKKAQKQFSSANLTREHRQNRLDFFNTKYSEIESAKRELETQIQQKQDVVKSDKTVSQDVVSQIKRLQEENQQLEEQLKELQKEINTLINLDKTAKDTTNIDKEIKATNIAQSTNQQIQPQQTPTQIITGTKPQKDSKKSHNKKFLDIHIPKIEIKKPNISEKINLEKSTKNVTKPHDFLVDETTITQPSSKAQDQTIIPQNKEIKDLETDKKKKAEETLSKVLDQKYKSATIVQANKVKKKPNQKNKQDVNVQDGTNIIHGVVKDANGKLLENAVVLIKNEKGDIERALKTNKLGHFKTQTKLDNGKYTIEVVKEKLKFDIIAVEVNDTVLPSVTLIAKE